MKKLVVILIVLSLILVGCKTEPPEVEPLEEHPLVSELPITERDFNIGLAGYVPRNWPNPGQEDWVNLFEVISEAGDSLGVQVQYTDAEEQAKLSEQVQGDLAIAIAVDVEQRDTEYIQGIKEDYKTEVLKIAEDFKPKFLGIGVEINRLFENNPEAWEDFVELQNELYDEVKTLSPQTKIYSTVQYEYLLGNAELAGNHNDHREIVNDLKLDLLGLSTYPWFDYTNPADIPSNYYTQILQTTNKPIAITETGWPTKDLVTGVEGSEDLQKDYFLRLLDLTKNTDLEFIHLAFPHDAEFGIAGTNIFDDISPRYNDGTPKLVYEYILAAKSL